MAERSRPGGPLNGTRQPSLTDVAGRAGVSHMTVSRVINGTGPVRPATRARVLAAIEELGYRPNSAARALVTGRTGTLGVLALESNLYGPASTLYGIENAAREAGFAITISSVSRPGRSSIADAVENLRGQAVEGIIVIAPHVTAGRALEAAPEDIPVVAVGGGDDAPVPVIAVDQRDGARRATEHLLALGHRTVWHIAGPEDWLEARDREAGLARDPRTPRRPGAQGRPRRLELALRLRRGTGAGRGKGPGRRVRRQRPDGPRPAARVRRSRDLGAA